VKVATQFQPPRQWRPPLDIGIAAVPSAYRPRRIRCRDGREATLRAIAESDAPEILRAFNRLSDESRYYRFMHAKKNLSLVAVERGVHPVPGRDFVFVATVARADGFTIVGAAQYVRARADDAATCEFAITVADDWRGNGLARLLLQSLVRRARRDRYTTMEGWVMAANLGMLGLAQRLGFKVGLVEGDASTLRVAKVL
jgi:L-amino acid N-acyltransferase YncA